ncbi:hypothetical protein IB274_26350 [Pseudomonas sp. PDM18]|uniref:hypothetical protein n=1 Tax=Pseudomonas sp. PDM18 TaxID=2769253 RepID=UPI0017850C7A|nr:hypothetical protein [Pseudomonas sp. PDM18]MBD9680253.1 hypothetical protein [Pseudomonas sp. PDM18]
MTHLVPHGLVDHDQQLRKPDEAEVFILAHTHTDTHTVGGVLRALLDRWRRGGVRSSKKRWCNWCWALPRFHRE